MKDIKKQDNRGVSKITNNSSVIKWIDSVKLHSNAIVGVCNCLFVYVVREQHDLLVVTCGTLFSYHLHSEEHSSVAVEMICLTSYDHTLFNNENGDVYDRMDWALSDSQYAPMIVRFCKNQEGDEAFQALVSQKVGNNFCRSALKKLSYT